MSINKGMNKQTLANSYKGIWLCNKPDELRIVNTMNESQYVEEKKQDSNEFILYDSICVKVKQRYN